MWAMCLVGQIGRTHYLAAMTGIHGVSSSLWLPRIQSYSGNRFESDGVIALLKKEKLQ